MSHKNILFFRKYNSRKIVWYKQNRAIFDSISNYGENLYVFQESPKTGVCSFISIHTLKIQLFLCLHFGKNWYLRKNFKSARTKSKWLNENRTISSLDIYTQKSTILKFMDFCSPQGIRTLKINRFLFNPHDFFYQGCIFTKKKQDLRKIA